MLSTKNTLLFLGLMLPVAAMAQAVPPPGLDPSTFSSDINKLGGDFSSILGALGTNAASIKANFLTAGKALAFFAATIDFTKYAIEEFARQHRDIESILYAFLRKCLGLLMISALMSDVWPITTPAGLSTSTDFLSFVFQLMSNLGAAVAGIAPQDASPETLLTKAGDYASRVFTPALGGGWFARPELEGTGFIDSASNIGPYLVDIFTWLALWGGWMTAAGLAASAVALSVLFLAVQSFVVLFESYVMLPMAVFFLAGGVSSWLKPFMDKAINYSISIGIKAMVIFAITGTILSMVDGVVAKQDAFIATARAQAEAAETTEEANAAKSILMGKGVATSVVLLPISILFIAISKMAGTLASNLSAGVSSMSAGGLAQGAASGAQSVGSAGAAAGSAAGGFGKAVGVGAAGVSAIGSGAQGATRAAGAATGGAIGMATAAGGAALNALRGGSGGGGGPDGGSKTPSAPTASLSEDARVTPASPKGPAGGGGGNAGAGATAAAYSEEGGTGGTESPGESYGSNGTSGGAPGATSSSSSGGGSGQGAATRPAGATASTGAGAVSPAGPSNGSSGGGSAQGSQAPTSASGRTSTADSSSASASNSVGGGEEAGGGGDKGARKKTPSAPGSGPSAQGGSFQGQEKSGLTHLTEAISAMDDNAAVGGGSWFNHDKDV